MANTGITINAVSYPNTMTHLADIEKNTKAFERNNFVNQYFETGTEAGFLI